jgi:hypothetical protein
MAAWSPELLAEEERPRRLYPVCVEGRYGYEGLYGYIDKTGKMVAEPKYEFAEDFSGGMGAVRIDEKWGFVDATGKLVIPATYDKVSYFSEGQCAVELDGDWGFVDRQGKLRPERLFSNARSFSQGLAAVEINGKWGYVNKDMKTAIEPKFDGAWNFTEDRAPVRMKRRWGYIDKSGKVVIKPKYLWVDNFSEGLAFVEGGKGREGYINRRGTFVIRRRFWDAHPFSERRAAVKFSLGGSYCLIDKSGKMISKSCFSSCGIFSEGMACATLDKKSGGLSGYIDTRGEIVIQLRKDYGRGPFCGGLARTLKGYIDKKGNYIWKPEKYKPYKAKKPATRPKRMWDEILEAKLTGPQGPPAKEVSLVGNPLRKRYPDEPKFVNSRNIREMILYKGRIYIGSGDAAANTGPVPIYSFEPGRKDFKIDYLAPDEQISEMHIFEDKLLLPGLDPKESWEFGNIYIKENGKWRKERTIPRGLHCFNLVFSKGSLFVNVSTDGPRKIMKSTDWGKSWEPVFYYSTKYSLPTLLFDFNDRLCAFDNLYNFYVYENGVLSCDKMIPKYEQLRARKAPSARTSRPNFFGNAKPFGNGIILFAGIEYSIMPESGPFPLFVLAQDQTKPAMVDLFAEENVMDTYVSGPNLYVLTTRKTEKGFENAVFATKDVKTWRSIVTFETKSFALSFVPVDGEFYVSIGRARSTPKEHFPLIGSILRVVPN